MEDEQSTSPTPVKPSEVELLPFPEALNRVLAGASISKMEWADYEYYGKMIDGTLRLHKPDGKFYDWIITEGDLMGEDWFII